MKRIRKAVLPVAGLGTRFLPATKSVPKEMLTVVDRPVIQHVVDEVKEAGIDTFRITGMVEKPPKGTAPSNLIISGRYILQPEIFDILSAHEKGAGGEIQLTDAMKRLAERQDFFGLRYRGRTYDTGNKLGFLTANVAYALERDDLAGPFRAELEAILKVR
ncbi:hypothetical protein JNW90_31180 [Micromonospora sp. STR1s_5]|nr:hypothetical protein [Micromonospora sp. STR1s_5]